MGILSITMDTHALLWYIDEPLKYKLSPIALEAIKKAEKDGIIYISAIVLMEMLDLIEKKRSSISFDKLMMMIQKNESYQIVPIDTDILKKTIQLKGLEIHDRLIIATAILTDTVIVCRDRKIRTMGFNVLW